MRFVLVLVMLAACDAPLSTCHLVSGHDHRSCPTQFDAREPGPSEPPDCNVFTQTGCNAGQKCTWVTDVVVPEVLGHHDCTPDGTKAIGEACTFGPPGATTGYDDCVKGSYCAHGTCAPICDLAGGFPSCDATHTCVGQLGAFEYAHTYFGGACEPPCDPLADNDFLGSGQRGSGCATGQGCYGPFARYRSPGFACSPEGDPALVHRSACGSACLAAPGLDGCAQGYVPMLLDATGSSQIDCVALCKPGNAYLGNPGVQYPQGQAPHRCSAQDARGTFGPTEHCMYSWRIAIDGSGVLHPSPTGDTVGICVDHASQGWPDCATLPLGSAAQYGCVDSATAGSNLPTTPW